MYKDPEVKRAKHREWQRSPEGKAWNRQYQKEYAKRNPEKIRQWKANRREATRVYMREYRKKYREKYKSDLALEAKWSHIKRQYGLSRADFKAKSSDQNDCCKICLRKLKLFVDHNHSTKEVRDLLCRYCNSILGWAREDPKVLRRAIRYLEKWNGKTKVTEA